MSDVVDGWGPLSRDRSAVLRACGSNLEMFICKANNHIVPDFLRPRYGQNFHIRGEGMFDAMKSIPGFDVDCRVTIVDMEKSIYSFFWTTMTSAKLFLDAVHIKNNMLPTLDVKRAVGSWLYNRAIQAPSQMMVSACKMSTVPIQEPILIDSCTMSST